MLNNSDKGDCIYEPFLGSGTTLIAAQTIGRLCLGVELNPAYIAIRRWQAFTGEQALLLNEDGSRMAFEDVAKRRASDQNRTSAQSNEQDRTPADTRESSQAQD